MYVHVYASAFHIIMGMYVCTWQGIDMAGLWAFYDRLIESNWEEIIFTALVEIFINIHTTVLCCNLYTEYNRYCRKR